MLDHSANDHSQGITSCFKDYTRMSGGNVLRSSIDLWAYDDAFHEPTVAVTANFNEFLNFAAPGTRRLLEQVNTIDSPFEVVSIADRHSFVVFSPSFFTRERMGRIFHLAAHILAEASSGREAEHETEAAVDSRFYGMSEEGLATLANWENEGRPDLDAEAVKTLLPEHRRDYDTIERVRMLLNVESRPAQISNLAEWIVTGTARLRTLVQAEMEAKA